jgi:hypothetical protein
LAKVNLIRLTHKKRKGEDEPDSFDRWISEQLGSFTPDDTKDSEERDLKLKQCGIEELIENYDFEMKTLLDAFKVFGKMSYRIVEALNMNRASILEIISPFVAGDDRNGFTVRYRVRHRQELQWLHQ